MTARTFNELFEPQIRLSLAHVHADRYIVWDQSCRYYVLAPVSLTCALNFMQEGADRGDWLIDEESVKRVTGVDAVEHSVPVPDDALSEEAAVGHTAVSSSARYQSGELERAAFSENPSNVYPIRLRPAEPLDETRKGA